MFDEIEPTVLSRSQRPRWECILEFNLQKICHLLWSGTYMHSHRDGGNKPKMGFGFDGAIAIAPYDYKTVTTLSILSNIASTRLCQSSPNSFFSSADAILCISLPISSCIFGLPPTELGS